MGLPSGLYEQDRVSTSVAYVDTGIIPNITTEIDITLWMQNITDTMQVLGCRNSSSAGNFRLYKGSSYFTFIYSNTTHNLSNIKYDDGVVRFIIKNGLLTAFSNTHTQEVELSETAFSTAAQYPIHLFGYNNAGTHIGVGDYNGYIYECKIWQNGELVRHYIPYYKYEEREDESYPYRIVNGLYDVIQKTQNTISTGSWKATKDQLPLTITSQNGYVLGDSGWRNYYNVKAIANKGYHFEKWIANDNGTETTIYGDNNTINYQGGTSTSRSLTAVFRKDAEDEKLPYRCYVKDKYNLHLNATCNMKVISGSFKDDLLQKSTSSIVVDEIASNVKIGDYICVYSPTGKTIYQGIIKSIDNTNNKLECREIMSLYDFEYLFNTNTSVKDSESNTYNLTTMPLQRALDDYYLARISYGGLNVQKWLNYDKQTIDIFTHLTRVGPVVYNHNTRSYLYGELIADQCPLISKTEIKNFETWLFELYEEYGVYLNFEIPSNQASCYVTPKYNNEEALQIGNNDEEVKDINVVADDAQTYSCLYVYDSTGATLRFVYTLDNNNKAICIYKGTTEKTPSGFVHTDKYNPKIVMSDDKINTILNQVFYSNTYNHKITFTINLDGKYNMDELSIGRAINFYNKGTLYNSVITAIDFDLEPNTNRIASAQITLGKVRTSLTSKLNLGYVK